MISKFGSTNLVPPFHLEDDTCLLIPAVLQGSRDVSQRRNLKNYEGRNRIIPKFGLSTKPDNDAKCRKSEEENRNARKKCFDKRISFRIQHN